ncbi:protein C2-DOMAIN ABA-RELATED 4-like [Punica granatum]|uniref:C2 domain-containing protein n=2 Tax=Punica granatum TaxID=22663 RepID=A0A218XNU2_PUNGR|nr:protein C2-DOMAIN ABA-RELATED 4-like [Punica granatum]OWM86171.1 hypothetical protein CDL15_Pgr010995 [Punica granatum]PKI66950.1 hypothetical protein CRG98_012713 [Punica granatum]
MDHVLGILKVRVKRGTNLVVRDALSSDPYVTVSQGNLKVKTRVVKKDCNPVWNDELTLSVTDKNLPLLVTVYDKDTFTADDKMGEAEIDIRPYLECIEMCLENLPSPTTIKRIQPGKDNCYAEESSIVWLDGKIVQDMILRLRNVPTGEVELQLEWIDLPGRN